MGFIKIIDINESGVSETEISELSFADKVELELAVTTPNAVQLACIICYTIIPNGNTCEAHKGMKPRW